MRQATKANSRPEHMARKMDAKAKRPDASLIAKTFEELNQKEKDDLLKRVALSLGFIKPS